MSSFRPGEVLRFEKSTVSFQRGSYVEVVEVRSNGLWVLDQTGARLPVSKRQAKCFSVYEKEGIRVAAGDRLQLHESRSRTLGRTVIDWGARLIENSLEPGSQTQVLAGEIQTVREISTDGTIVLEDGRRLPKDYKHFSHGYVVSPSSALQQKPGSVLIDADRLQREEVAAVASHSQDVQVHTSSSFEGEKRENVRVERGEAQMEKQERGVHR